MKLTNIQNLQNPKFRLCFWITVLFLLHFLGAWLYNLPQSLAVNIPEFKFKSLSFAPYWDGYSPVDEKYPLPEHIDQDLQLLAGKTGSIRTYSVLGGMEPTPDFARKHGMNMIQGGWLGDGAEGNQKEIAALIETANAHPDVIKRVIVGNEVLLRHDMNVDTLIGYIRQVKQAIKQPVSYADVWSNYLKYPQLMQEVDFITIHVLPYWEDQPVSIDQALAHVEQALQQVELKAISLGQNKPILIGESGWPAAGRQRGQAIPSVVNQARFIRGFLELADRRQIDYNIVEAFDQTWKGLHEGAVGANWGLWSVERKPLFSANGAVQENPHWYWQFAVASALWLAIVLINRKHLYELPSARLPVFVALSALLSVEMLALVCHLWSDSFSVGQKVYTLLVSTANLLLAALLLQYFYQLLADKPKQLMLYGYLRVSYLGFLILAAFKIWNLALNGRYLDFPVTDFAIPVSGILAATLILRFTNRHTSQFSTIHELTGYHRVLASLVFIGIPSTVIGETHDFISGNDFVQAYPDFWQALPVALGYSLQNTQLILWLLFASILALPFWENAGAAAERVHHKR